MAHCKFCNQPVRSGTVIHSACWERETQKVAEIFCDDYCRWPRECADEESLDELHCSDCALIQLLTLGL